MATEPARALLVQFARAPQPGRVKTRMQPQLNGAQSLALHRAMVLHTCRTLRRARLGPVQVCVAGALSDPLFTRCRGYGASLARQSGADLGERMYRALVAGLRRHGRVVLVGSDCPALDADYLGAACAALDTVDVVLGPAVDGGYVLIGVRRLHVALFRGIPWGGAQVFAETQARLRETGLSWCALAPLADVDRPEDLPLWRDRGERWLAGDRARGAPATVLRRRRPTARRVRWRPALRGGT